MTASTKTSNLTKGLATLLALGALLAGFAGCGSGDEGGGDSTATGTEAGTASTSSTASTTSTGGTTTPAPATPTGTTGDGTPPLTSKQALNTIGDILVRQGLDPEIAKCVENELRKTLTDADVKDLNGTPPPGFQAKIAAAAQACAP